MKKILVLLLSIVLLVAVLPTVNVFAAKEPTFVVSSEKAHAGDTVKITVSTKENTGIVSMKLLVKYDANALELVEFKEGKFSGTAFSPKTSNPFIINWIDSINPNNKTNGTVATLTFKVLDTAPNGKSNITLTYDPEDVFDLNFENVTFAVKNGYVDIENPNADKQPVSKPVATSSENTASQQSNDTVVSKEEQLSSGGNQMQDTTTSQILGQIYDSAEQNNSQSIETEGNNQNGWLLWVVIAAVLVLGGTFAVVIINSKKK